jgi:hypothetical protein
MTARVDLKLDQSAFDRLHEVSDTRRSMVKVERDYLATLLMDYSVMLAALRSSGSFKVTEPESPRERRRLK